MNEAFQTHFLDENGIRKAQRIAELFSNLLIALDDLAVPNHNGREMAIARTKLEEACFFAKKAMAKGNCKPAE